MSNDFGYTLTKISTLVDRKATMSNDFGYTLTKISTLVDVK
jgi:hypothetical protein